MRKLSCVFLILLLLITACTRTDIKNSAAVEEEIHALIEARLHSVNTLDQSTLISILDPSDKELQTEQMNWLKDMETTPIENYNLELLDLNQIKADEYRVKLRQSYKVDGKDIGLEYYNKFKRVDGKLYDAGNYFEEVKQGNITIKYTPANKKLAEDVIEDMNQLYQENIERWKLTPKRSLVIKMFDNIEELRQSIKFSMWQCGGWYEYGESVKLYVPKIFAGKEEIRQVVNHEMIHLFTVEKSSGNLAYWFSEGIASYYEMPQNQEGPSQLARSMETNLLTLDELENIELEKLKDQQKISDYYNNAHLITAYLIEHYGEEKISEILIELGKLPSFNGTTAENDMHYREYLSKVLPKVLGIDDYNVFKQGWENEINKL